MITLTHTAMTTESTNILRLMTWLSPVFPTGGFSYSHGLEWCTQNSLVSNQEDLEHWIKTLLTDGSIWNDCVLLTAAHNATDSEEINRLIKNGEAIAGSKERHLETMKQGEAFLQAAKPWAKTKLPTHAPLPIAIGVLARENQIDLHATLIAFLQSFVANQIQTALRLMSLGQTRGLAVQNRLEETVLQVANKASSATLEDLGSNTFFAEIAAMKHETLHSRIFRS